MPNEKLIEFIREARDRGFSDYQIKEPLIKNKWPLKEIEEAFASLKYGLKIKNRVEIFLDSEVLKILTKRADKNMLTLSEQIEDILRRSAVNARKIKKQEEKLDDMFVTLFSRKNKKIKL